MPNKKYGNGEFNLTYHMKSEDPREQAQQELAIAEENFLLKNTNHVATGNSIHRYLNANQQALALGLIPESSVYDAFKFAKGANTSKLTSDKEKSDALLAKKYAETECALMAVSHDINNGICLKNIGDVGTFYSKIVTIVNGARDAGSEPDTKNLVEALHIEDHYNLLQAQKESLEFTPQDLFSSIKCKKPIADFLDNNLTPLFNPTPNTRTSENSQRLRLKK